MIKVAHFADLHYCPKHLDRVDRAFGYAVDVAVKMGANLAIIAGDTFDASMGIHEPAVAALMGRLSTLAKYMPVVVLQGTFSHDRPGSLEVLRHIPGVQVVDEPGVVACKGVDLDIFCLPSINKTVPAVVEAGGVAQWVESLMQRWCSWNSRIHPSILVSHGTIGGCRTESGHAMVSPDHEFSVHTLLSSGVDAVMLGHIHLHQSFTLDGRHVVYAGSISRLVFGHEAQTGFVMWEISDTPTHTTTWQFISVPSPPMTEIVFDGPPDMELLRQLAATSAGAMVRVRYQVDEEYARFVDKAAIREMFSMADLRLEAQVNPVQRVRAPGIGTCQSVPDRMRVWAGQAGVDRLEDILKRYDLLLVCDVDQIINEISENDIPY